MANTTPPGEPAARLGTARDGLVAVAGSSSNNMATVVYDTNGNEMFSDWRSASGGASDVAIGLDGSVYVCGGDGPTQAALLVALGPTGAQAWTLVHRGPHGPFGYARRLAIDSAGNIVAVG